MTNKFEVEYNGKVIENVNLCIFKREEADVMYEHSPANTKWQHYFVELFPEDGYELESIHPIPDASLLVIKQGGHMVCSGKFFWEHWKEDEGNFLSFFTLTEPDIWIDWSISK